MNLENEVVRKLVVPDATTDNDPDKLRSPTVRDRDASKVLAEVHIENDNTEQEIVRKPVSVDVQNDEQDGNKEIIKI